MHYGYQPPQPKPDRTPLIVVSLVALLAFVQYRNGDWPFDGTFDRQQDRQVQPDDANVPDDHSEDASIDNILSDAYAVFVYELKDATAAQETIYRSADDFIVARNMAGKRRYDDDNPSAARYIEQAQANGHSPPFVAIVRDRKITHTAPFPTSYAELEKALR